MLLCVLPSNATLPTSLCPTLLPAGIKPTLFPCQPGATRSQSPQADTLISYLSLGIVCRYPSENITTLFSADERLETGKLSKWWGNFRCSVSSKWKMKTTSGGSQKFPNGFSEKLLFHLTFNWNSRSFSLMVRTQWSLEFRMISLMTNQQLICCSLLLTKEKNKQKSWSFFPILVI